tara:strand:- start:234 stop:581 length:348 start_codon:yes stop_codon:yes gene_type:complete
MSNRENKYINKDDFSSIMNNMSNSDVTKDDKPVSSKRMRSVLIIIYIILSLLLLYGFFSIYVFVIVVKENKVKNATITIIIYILFCIVIIYLLLNSIYMSHKITKFIENNLLFKI